jgi:hypothetical protein
MANVALPKKKLGELLLELGLIDRDQLNSALAYQRQWGHRLGTSLVAKGFISEGTLIHVLSHTLGIPMVDLSQIVADKEALKLLPASTCEAHEVIPLSLEGVRGRRTLVLAMADPLNIAVQEEIGFTSGCKVKPVIASSTAILLAVRSWLRHERGISIPPVTYDKPRGASGTAGSGAAGGAQTDPPTEEMTIVARGGEEVILRNKPPKVDPAAPPLPSAVVSNPGVPMPPPPGLGAPQQMMQQQPQQPPYSAVNSGNMPVQPGQGWGQPLPTGMFAAPPGYPYPQPMMPPGSMPQGIPGAVPGWPVPPPPMQVPMHDPVEELEKKFWAVMRVLARKGLITKEEFLKEMGQG